ncbi:hypothetical protein ABHN11_24690 [Brevibacillus centrosporus]|uniref:hypothetical protein n=1 Tax=Brevibacillus centrosporus TaxID=54910 RepID=UPI003D1A570C
MTQYKVQENIAEIAMYVGSLIAEGKIDQKELGISSMELSYQIIQWAEEFEEQYASKVIDKDPSGYEQFDVLGNPFGYPDAIDNYTEKKCKEQGWMTDQILSPKK